MGFAELWTQKREHNLKNPLFKQEYKTKVRESKPKSMSLLNRVPQVRPMISTGVPPIKLKPLSLQSHNKRQRKKGQSCNSDAAVC